MPNWNNGVSPSSNPQGGDLMWDNAIGQLRVYNGDRWLPLHAPTNILDPTNGATRDDGAVTGLGSVTLPTTTGTPTFIPAGMNGTGHFGHLVYDIVAKRLWAHTGATWVII